MRIAIVTALLLTAACSRSHSSGARGIAEDASDDGPSASVQESDSARVLVDAAAPHATLLPEEEPPATFVGARRAHLATLDDEPGLAKNAAVIKAHFGGALPAGMELQAVPLASGRQALLLSAAAEDPQPIAFVVDATGTALLTKEHPLGGIAPPARPFAMAPRPDGGLALFVFDEPTKLVAARMSAADGAPYAELVLFELQRCDAISAAWWPHRGWIVVTSFPAGMRAQLVRENGMPAWDPHGIPVGEPWRAPAPASIVIDEGTSSWVLVQNATRAGADHVVMARYDADGNRVSALKAARDLGAAGHVTRTLDRVEASLARPGMARVVVAGRAVEVGMEERGR